MRTRSEHAHQALGRRAGGLAGRLEADRGVDMVAQDRLAGREIACKRRRDRLLQERLAEGGIAFGARLNGLKSLVSATSSLLAPAAGSPPIAPARL